ncbi:hypothetical protein [Streptosporangium carneum]|uniref:Uncharacterized protein n=1 Tax=Streptosporangium carneum TaxID=47481 RepID=A0A9W6I134_9ACTN|nr:hypothetical protein [Streptosporangium carneum]GLK10082.1 hypothetical protein GCM10017600_34880 [Streptosporangium carneum]
MLKHMFAAVLLAAVAASPAAARADVPARAAPGTPAATIFYEKSGGFAGIHQAITIDRYGRAHGTNGDTTADFRLTPAEFRALQRRLAYIRTWSSSREGCDIADHFTYTLVYRDRHATRCHEPPYDWRPAIAQFEELVARYLTDPSPTPGD